MTRALRSAPLLPISLGLADGILNALTLAAASLVAEGLGSRSSWSCASACRPG